MEQRDIDAKKKEGKERKKPDDFFGILFTYIYPIFPMIEFLTDKFGNGWIGISFILSFAPIFWGIMLMAVNTGMAGRGNILEVVLIVLVYFFTSIFPQFIQLILIVNLVTIYGLGYYQLLIKK